MSPLARRLQRNRLTRRDTLWLASAATLAAPMNGNLVKWVAEDGAVVAAGDTIAVLEAMKMESNVTAHASGTFTRGGQAPGTMISRGEAMGSIA